MIVPSDLEAEFSEVLAAHLVPDVAGRYRALGRPAVHLRFDEHDDISEGSRLGGYPVLPTGVDWPACVDERGGDSRLLVCMAVLDLAQLAAHIAITGLPPEGFLTFFYADDASTPPWGEPEQVGGWRVVYAPPGTAQVTEPPAPVTVWAPHALVAEQAMTYPLIGYHSREEVDELVGLKLSDDALFEIVDGFGNCKTAWDAHVFAEGGPFNRSGHQIGGIPRPMQGDPIAEADWLLSGGQPCGRRLLLQIDGDTRITDQLQRNPLRTYNEWLGLDFTAYFVIEDDDLRARDFSKVWLIAQR